MLFTQNALKRLSLFSFALIFSLILFVPHAINAQNANLEQLKAKAIELYKQNDLLSALPVLEKIVQMDDKDAEMEFYLGFALLAKSINSTNETERKQLRARARATFVTSKKLGNTETLVDALIQSIPPDGGATGKYSSVEAAEAAMNDGEKAFSSGKGDEALAFYQKALKLDPKIYEAALYSGDVYTEKGDYANAETAYQKAIAIDPNRETAYRYSATPLMKQNKTLEARDRYVEAFITEPYSNFALSGMVQWGKLTGTGLGHPSIDIPEYKVGADGKAVTTINISPQAGDGSLAWISYTAKRTEWHDTKFAKTFPNEKTYRHTLQEEAEALRSVIGTAKDLQKNAKTINPQIALLNKLDQDGLLEAYILMAIPDQGIARDHAEYLRQNRAKLRQYVVKYVIHEN